jgi:hypothetical protein
MKTINWTPKRVLLSKVRPSPVNYKIKNALGAERFKESLKQFGLAGTVVVNTDLTLIDGNSRLEEMAKRKLKHIWVSIPDRKLSPKEFAEMCAVFDYSVAGDVDIVSIERDYGDHTDFLKRYGMTVSMDKLKTLGANAKVAKFPEGKKGKEPETTDVKMVQLFFTVKQEEEFRRIEERLMRKLKTTNTTDTVLKAFKTLSK